MKKITYKLRRNDNNDAVEPNSRITNDTVAEHREQVLGQARKYIYPLRQSKHKLVKISISLFLVAVIVFFTYCILALYKFKSTSPFIYKVTQVIPFPVARTGSDFVAYENYLFEINHYTHYYRTQQNLDFNSDAGRQQLAEFKKRALDKVINDAYIKELAARKNVTVSDQEVDQRIAVARDQSRLGANDEEFRRVLKDQWNWSDQDFKRTIKTLALSDKVASVYDTDAHDRAKAAFDQLKSGKDFATLAKEVSEEPVSKANGGDYGFSIAKTDPNVNPIVVDELYALKDGEHSKILDVGYGLEIVKRIQSQSDGKIRASHIVFNFKDINDYTNDLKDQKKARVYLSL